MEDKMNQDFNQEFKEVEKIDVAELDDALIAVRDAEAEHQEAHKISAEKWAVLQEAKAKLVDLMDRAGKDRWSVSGVKGFSLRETLKYKFTKDMHNKEKFFNFLSSQKVGDLLKQDPREVFLSYGTIHAGSFNTLCKKLVEEAAVQGESLQLPGIDSPVTEKTLVSLRK